MALISGLTYNAVIFRVLSVIIIALTTALITSYFYENIESVPVRASSRNVLTTLDDEKLDAERQREPDNLYPITWRKSDWNERPIRTFSPQQKTLGQEPRLVHLGVDTTQCNRNNLLSTYMKTANLLAWPVDLYNYRSPCFHTPSGPKCLPYLHLFGVAKSGTSMIHRQLLRHGDILESAMREESFLLNQGANFWDYVKDFELATSIIYGNKNERGYHQKFAVEASPMVFTSPGNTWPPNRQSNKEPNCTMAHTTYCIFPGDRIIVSLRDPIMRLLSHFRQRTVIGGATMIHSPDDFHKSVVKAINLMKSCLSRRSLRSCAFDKSMELQLFDLNVTLLMSLYYPYAAEWLSVYSPSRIYFIKADELYRDARGVMSSVFRFLQLDTSADLMDAIAEEMDSLLEDTQEKERKNTSFHNHIREDTRTILNDFFDPYNRQLATLLRDDKWLFQSKK